MKFEPQVNSCKVSIWQTLFLANQLTLSQPRGANYAHHSTTSPPGFSDLATGLPEHRRKESGLMAAANQKVFLNLGRGAMHNMNLVENLTQFSLLI